MPEPCIICPLSTEPLVMGLEKEIVDRKRLFIPSFFLFFSVLTHHGHFCPKVSVGEECGGGEGEGPSARQGFDRRFVVKKGWFAWSPLWTAGSVGTEFLFFFTLFSFRWRGRFVI